MVELQKFKNLIQLIEKLNDNLRKAESWRTDNDY